MLVLVEKKTLLLLSDGTRHPKKKKNSNSPYIYDVNFAGYKITYTLEGFVGYLPLPQQPGAVLNIKYLLG